MNSKKSVKVVARSVGRLDQVLLQSWSLEDAPTRSQITRWIKQGSVFVDGQNARKPGWQIEAHHQEIMVTLEVPQQPPVLDLQNVGVEILYQDDHLVVINKPPGLVVHPGAGTKGVLTLVDLLQPLGFKLNAGESGRPGIVHRLDKDTSGVLVLARTALAHAKLADQFAAREVQKEYLAVVIETPRRRTIFGREDVGVIDLPIGRDQNNRTRMCAGVGRAAFTAWSVKERFARGVLLQLNPRSGRTHQIRVHCFSEQAPLYGDGVYRRADFVDVFVERAERVIQRQALHAHKITFLHPSSHELVSFCAPLPEDFCRLLEHLRNKDLNEL